VSFPSGVRRGAFWRIRRHKFCVLLREKNKHHNFGLPRPSHCGICGVSSYATAGQSVIGATCAVRGSSSTHRPRPAAITHNRLMTRCCCWCCWWCLRRQTSSSCSSSNKRPAASCHTAERWITEWVDFIGRNSMRVTAAARWTSTMVVLLTT